MSRKAKPNPSDKMPPTAKTSSYRQPVAPMPQPDSRWQRTKRYGWDKGGALGGRKS